MYIYLILFYDHNPFGFEFTCVVYICCVELACYQKKYLFIVLMTGKR